MAVSSKMARDLVKIPGIRCMRISRDRDRSVWRTLGGNFVQACLLADMMNAHSHLTEHSFEPASISVDRGEDRGSTREAAAGGPPADHAAQRGPDDPRPSDVILKKERKKLPIYRTHGTHKYNIYVIYGIEYNKNAKIGKQKLYS